MRRITARPSNRCGAPRYNGDVPELGDVLGELRWQDIADIAILSFLLHRAYAWVRGTVALQVAVGMLTLLAAAWAAGQLGLVLTAYVLQGISAVTLLVAVVVFRDEIRGALGRASPLRWWRSRQAGSAGPPSPRDVLAEALFNLAQRRIGALVVIPRQDPVHDRLTGGLRVDARLSPQLLESIFQPASPLHDGAVVLSEDGRRIELAGVVLPLTTSTEVPEMYGTRHRAALGLSELCDALVLVVSEERGQVALVVGGTVARPPFSPAELAHRLSLALGNRNGPAPLGEPAAPRRRWQPRNALVRVAILAGVIVAWLVVAGNRGAVLTREVAVEVLNIPPQLDLLSVRPSEVTVHLRGPRQLLGKLTGTEVRATIDLSNASEGSARPLVRVNPPLGVEVLRVVPARVSTRLRRVP
jgi:uncharacterized protein (TIGR00159 family)